MSVPDISNDSLNRSEKPKINGVNIQDSGTLSRVIQDIWAKNARRLSGSLSSVKKEDERSLKQDDQLSNSESFTSNFDEVFDSPGTSEIPEDYKVAHPYNTPSHSNPYIQRYNVNTPGKNPFMSLSSKTEKVEKLVDITEIPCTNNLDNAISDMGPPRIITENEPLTPLRACKPRICRTPSIKLHTPEPSKSISLAHSRAFVIQDQHNPGNKSPKQVDSPMPMPRTNPNHARFRERGSNYDGTPFRYPGDGELSPTTSTSERFKPLHNVVSRTRTNTDTGSLYQVESNDEQDDDKNHSKGTTAPAGGSFDKSLNLVDISPASSEPLLDLGSTPVDLGSLFAASNTPRNEEKTAGEFSERSVDDNLQNSNLLSVQQRNEVSLDVTPAPTVCSSSYQAQLGSDRSSYLAQLGSGLSAATGMSLNLARDSISSCQTHRLDFYQPPDPQDEKTFALKLKIGYALIIIGASFADRKSVV